MVDFDKKEIIVRSNLKQLVLQREIEEQRRIPQTEIAEATGLNPMTISRWMSPKPFKRIETDPLVRLCRWLKVEIADLLVAEPGNSADAT